MQKSTVQRGSLPGQEKKTFYLQERQNGRKNVCRKRHSSSTLQTCLILEFLHVWPLARVPRGLEIIVPCDFQYYWSSLLSIHKHPQLPAPLSRRKREANHATINSWQVTINADLPEQEKKIYYQHKAERQKRLCPFRLVSTLLSKHLLLGFTSGH